MAYNHETSDGERIFSPLYADVWDTTLKHLNGSAVKVYIALLMHTTQQDRTWFMSIDEIAEDAGISRSAASDGKNKLVEVGLIQQRWRYRDEAGNYHLAIKRPPPRLQGKNVYTVKVKPVSVDAENQQEDANRVRNSTPIESENRHLVDAEIQHQTITPTTQPPREPLSPLTPQGGNDNQPGNEIDIFDATVVDDQPTPKKTETRGHRLPDNWMPTQESIGKMYEEFPELTEEALVREHRKFSDYWPAKAGRAGVKKDWDATWRNWIRTAMERNQPRKPQAQRQQQGSRFAGMSMAEISALAKEQASA